MEQANYITICENYYKTNKKNKILVLEDFKTYFRVNQNSMNPHRKC